MNKVIAAALFSVVLSGCNKGAPDFDDVTAIVVDGKPYTSYEYLRAFCRYEGAHTDENCITVDKQHKIDQTKIKNIDW